MQAERHFVLLIVYRGRLAIPLLYIHTLLPFCCFSVHIYIYIQPHSRTLAVDRYFYTLSLYTDISQSQNPSCVVCVCVRACDIIYDECHVFLFVLCTANTVLLFVFIIFRFLYAILPSIVSRHFSRMLNSATER